MLILNKIPGKKFKGLLDGLISPTLIASTRKLISNYSGFCWEITRLSDGDSIDIGFDRKGNPDRTAISAFVGDSDYKVGKIYNQNPAFPNLIQSLDNAKPLVADNNPKPSSLSFDGSNDNLTSNSVYGIDNTTLYTAFLVVDVPTNTKGAFFKIGGGDGIGIGVGVNSMDEAGNNLILLHENRAWIPTTLNVQGRCVITARCNDGVSSTAWVNKTRQNLTVGSNNLLSPSSTTSFGGYSNNNRFYTGKQSAVIVYNSILSDATCSTIQDRLISLI